MEKIVQTAGRIITVVALMSMGITDSWFSHLAVEVPF